MSFTLNELGKGLEFSFLIDIQSILCLMNDLHSLKRSEDGFIDSLNESRSSHKTQEIYKCWMLIVNVHSSRLLIISFLQPKSDRMLYLFLLFTCHLLIILKLVSSTDLVPLIFRKVYFYFKIIVFPERRRTISSLDIRSTKEIDLQTHNWVILYYTCRIYWFSKILFTINLNLLASIYLLQLKLKSTFKIIFLWY